jgi:hypothetical protein
MTVGALRTRRSPHNFLRTRGPRSLPSSGRAILIRSGRRTRVLNFAADASCPSRTTRYGKWQPLSPKWQPKNQELEVFDVSRCRHGLAVEGEATLTISFRLLAQRRPLAVQSSRWLLLNARCTRGRFVGTEPAHVRGSASRAPRKGPSAICPFKQRAISSILIREACRCRLLCSI